MSSICRVCTNQMPKDRKGWEQVCPLCREKGHKELLDPTFNYEKDRKLKINKIKKFLCLIFGHKWDKKWKEGQDICGRCRYIGYQWE